MRTIEQMISMEVHYCVSSLVSTLAAGAGRPRCKGYDAIMDLSEQAQDLAAPIDDYETAAREGGWVKRTFGTTVKWVNPANDDGSGYCDNSSSLRHLCEDHDIDPYESEVYEHWIVSEWFADKLAAEGEKVDKDFAGMIVWARQTTGQAIYADGVVERIYAATHTAEAK